MSTNTKELVSHTITGDTREYDFQSIIPKPWAKLNVHNTSVPDEETRETVCGIDERVKVMNTRVMPNQAICKLYMRTTTSKNYVGSGFLTHDDKVVTAGHCVYDHDEGGWMDSIIVVPAKNGVSTPYGQYNAVRIAAVRAWTDSRSVRYDMGVIKLNAKVTHSGRISMNLANSDRVTVCGYPADRDLGIFQYRMEDIIEKTNDGRLYYHIDTYGGQSGCPVLKNSNTSIAIHNYGGCPNKASDFYQQFIDEVTAF